MRTLLSGITVLFLLYGSPAQGQEQLASAALQDYLEDYDFSSVSAAVENNLPKLGKVVTVQFRDATLKQALQQVAERGGLKLSYKKGVFSDGKRINLDLKDVTVLEALHRTLRGTALQTKVSYTGQLIIKRSERPRMEKPRPIVGGAQGGRITGTVTDAATEQPLPGVNVVLVEDGESTNTGAQTNAEGYYTMLNVPPGTYSVRASFVGYAPLTKEGVRVSIDQTTEINFALQEQTAELEEITVQATEPVVQPDVSANVANLSSEDMESLPVAGVEEVVSLQAGVEPGLSVRGGGRGELAFLVNGMTTRSGRTNAPFTGISYTSIQEMQVQTGGFSAKYGNVRSGLVNVVTKEGPRDHYIADALLRYSAPSRKYFRPEGVGPEDSEAYWMRPWVDPDVAFEGTDQWDSYLQDQYPQFEGWNQVSETLKNDDNPNNDLSPEQAQETFYWRHRKSFTIDNPDYDADVTIGGPVPGISNYLGDLRFLGSYRQTQNTYLIPQARDFFQSRTVQLQMTSDVARSLKLQLLGLYGEELGINSATGGGAGMYRGSDATGWGEEGLFAPSGTGGDGLYADHTRALQDVTRTMFGGTLTHTLGSNTFYEVNLQRQASDYFTRPGRRRDNSTVKTIGSMELDEAPFGFPEAAEFGLSSLRLGGHWAESRDSSNVAVWSGKFDITSQVNQYLQLQGGGEYIYYNYQMNHGEEGVFPSLGYPIYRWNRQPTQGAAYTEAKLEFEGMIANVGLRLDHFNPRGTWYEYTPYCEVFSGQYGFEEGAIGELECVQETTIEPQYYLSPRLGVSFPITTNSKLYFNYGFFRQMLDPTNIFVIRQTTLENVDQVGNPSHPFPTTVAYELGYEQNLFNQFLLRLTGYYKALENQPRGVLFVDFTNQVRYSKSLPYNYEDIRGFEVSLRKSRGQWFRGFANYTLMVQKEGNFGFATVYESRSDQRQFERESRAHYQSKPVPSPYARVSLDFFTPSDFGPEIVSQQLLGDWHLNLLGTWRAGDTFTWAGQGGSIPGLRNNVQWADYYNIDLRLSKNFVTSVGDAKLFVDLSNVLNTKHLSRIAYQGTRDRAQYLESLHLPEDTFEDSEEGAPYLFIPGDDKPGDFREPGVGFVPIEVHNQLPDAGQSRAEGFYGPLYYEKQSGSYYVWEGNSFEKADETDVERVLDDKAYIDMPNEQYYRFLNPRRVLFGVRVSI